MRSEPKLGGIDTCPRRHSFAEQPIGMMDFDASLEKGNVGAFSLIPANLLVMIAFCVIAANEGAGSSSCAGGTAAGMVVLVVVSPRCVQYTA